MDYYEIISAFNLVLKDMNSSPKSIKFDLTSDESKINIDTDIKLLAIMDNMY